MSTRAAYEIPAGPHAGIGKTNAITYYVHSNGYPEGAAYKLYNMYKQLKKRKDELRNSEMSPNAGFAEAFLLGNPRAEFTKNHFNHSDLEWRYGLSKDGNLTVYKRIAWTHLEQDWVIFYTGPYYEFINLYLPKEQSTRLPINKEIVKDLFEKLLNEINKNKSNFVSIKI